MECDSSREERLRDTGPRAGLCEPSAALLRRLLPGLRPPLPSEAPAPDKLFRRLLSPVELRLFLRLPEGLAAPTEGTPPC